MIAPRRPARVSPHDGQDGRWRVDALPWLSVTTTGRREARAAIAEWLDVAPDTFDVKY